jgi:glucose/arabinose dehydrogenase
MILYLLPAFFFLITAPALTAQTLPPCDQRPAHIDPPWADGRHYCLEQVIKDESAGELGFTALAVGDDGTLYAAQPLYGRVVAFTGWSDDGLPDAPRVVMDGLSLPSALAYHDGALYVAGGARIDRLQAGEAVTLVADLPAGAGFWTGGIAIGPDERLYVATGANCDFCLPDAGRGVIYSYALDGSDRQLVAQGLRQPAALAFHDGALWAVDSARDGLFDVPDLDELNQVTPGAHFGWPYCVGAVSMPDMPGDFDCAAAAPPLLTFATGSNPLSLASYRGGALPRLEGALLVVLGGSSGRLDLRGFGLVAVRFDAAGVPVSVENIIPSETYTFPRFTLQEMNYRTSGFWPRHPLGVAVSRDGLVYISVGGGQILVIRPV